MKVPPGRSSTYDYCNNKRGNKIRKILPKNQHTQRKLLKFENWCSWEVSKSAKISLSKLIFYVKNHPSHFFSLKNTNLGAHFLLCIDIF